MKTFIEGYKCTRPSQIFGGLHHVHSAITFRVANTVDKGIGFTKGGSDDTYHTIGTDNRLGPPISPRGAQCQAWLGFIPGPLKIE